MSWKVKTHFWTLVEIHEQTRTLDPPSAVLQLEGDGGIELTGAKLSV